MTQTTIKVDSDVFAELCDLAATAHRTPEQHLRYLVEKEKERNKYDCFGLGELTPEQQDRADSVFRVEASEALEGYRPLREEGGYAYELQKRWVLGEITSEDETELLKKHYGIK